MQPVLLAFFRGRGAEADWTDETHHHSNLGSYVIIVIA